MAGQAGRFAPAPALRRDGRPRHGGRGRGDHDTSFDHVRRPPGEPGFTDSLWTLLLFSGDHSPGEWLDLSSVVPRGALLAAYPSAGFETVARIAERAGVSAPTVIRFAHRLGYRGFPDFQRALRDELEQREASPVALYTATGFAERGGSPPRRSSWSPPSPPSPPPCAPPAPRCPPRTSRAPSTCSPTPGAECC
ncbi:MurR/RpiR family transcriptional regulator [Streptomyces radiopugnans]|uniref:MurR/RpiR family transcriptional regulator n=1 Tax=Streptomyces radiopugnans TaxID=403935 RepID=UPI003F193627